MLRTVLAVALLVACASGTRVAFEQTDPHFAPRPGALPRVFLADDADALPRDRMRSVGILEISVRTTDDDRLRALVAERGQQLGCWIVVAHELFEQRRAAFAYGARGVLAHGTPHAGPDVRAPQRRRFDCVLPADA